MTDPVEAPRAPAAAPGAAWSAKLREHRGLAIALVALVVVASVWRCVRERGREEGEARARAEGAADLVKVLGPGLISVAPGSPLESKLAVGAVKAETVTLPRLTVTGSVAARLSAGADDPEARWDFSQPDLASAWADWLRARTDEPFAQQQLEKTRQLAAARVVAQTKLVDRLRKLVAVGTDSPRDLAAAEADLVQAQLEGQKQVYEAETAFKNASRTRTALDRQLLQAGIDPGLLAQAQPGTAIVVADVPESQVGLVHEGQESAARFYALPGETFAARVSSVAPTLSSERRTLRVFFELDDPRSHLRPGLFAEVGLGTEPREAILIPADAVLHIGRADYVLVRAQPGTWRVTEVRVGEATGANLELLSGVAAGSEVIESGAIILKPLVVEALAR
jgi:membrane fusion protein, heavy metal efflux system